MTTRQALPALAGAGILTLTLVAAGPGVAGAHTAGARVSAEMDGSQETPAGDPFATGFAEARFKPGAGEACWEVSHDLVPEPFGFHIHEGPLGENGAIVVDFDSDPATTVAPSGCITGVDPAVLNAIIRSPEGYYFNLHNAVFPNGAIRGQLSKP